MQTRREKLGYEMMLLPSLEEFVPADDRLRKLNAVLDLSFVAEAVAGSYCADNGRPSIDPEVVLRLFILQAMEGIRSVRALMRQVHLNLGYRWFIGYAVTEKVPDHSTLSRALDRFGDAVFNALFARSIAQCLAAGLVDGEVLHLDATVIRADLDACRVGDPESPDPDARFGRGAGGQMIPAYKQQTVVDGGSRVIVGIEVTPGNAPDQVNAVPVVDQACGHLRKTPAAVCADAGYATGTNQEAMAKRDIRLVSPPSPPTRARGSDLFVVTDFTYDEKRNVYICPAEQPLAYVRIVQGRAPRHLYRAPRSVCAVCSLRSRCTRGVPRTLRVTLAHRGLMRLRADAQTASFRALYRARAPMSEGIFAEGKGFHGLRRAWWRGLLKMRMQSHLVAAVLNFKRLAAAGGPLWRLWNALIGSISALLRTVDAAGNTRTHPSPQLTNAL